MKRWQLLVFAPLLCIAPLVAACGDDDDNNNNPTDGGGQTDGPGTTDGPDPGDAGKDSNDGSVDLTSFPKYVKSLIEVKTTATGLPEPEAVWGPIPDDDKFAYPTTFFP